MPVGKVFNAAENQVLISPVTSYYQGKAIRAQQKEAEQVSELRDLEIKTKKQELLDAPSNKKKAEELYKLQYDKAKVELDRAEVEYGKETLGFMANVLSGPLSDATQMAINGDMEGGVAHFNDSLKSQIPNLPPQIAEKVKQGAGEDGIYQPEEIANMKLMLGAWYDKEGSPRTQAKFIVDGKAQQGSFDKAGNYYYSDGSPVLGKIQPVAPSATQSELNDPRTSSQRGAAYQESINRVNSAGEVREMIASSLPLVAELPRTVGATGKIAMGGSGLLSALGQEEAASAFANAVAGADQETISAMQVKLQALRARIIPLVTGERSTRLSEQEREIASKTVGLIDSIQGPADLTKSYPQVIGAMKQLYEESWVTAYTEAKNSPEIDYPYNLNDRDELAELFEQFSVSGIDEKSSKRAVARLMAIQGGGQ